MANFFIFLFFNLILVINLNAHALEKCSWDNREGHPCVTISKTPNTSLINQSNINKKIFSKKEILESGASDAFDILKLVTGLDYYQSGQKGQTGAIFMRGSESNHTLVLLNGIAINDQSATNGIHDFGQDFIQTIQQVEVYKGSSGAHFGPDAIGGAINFVTDIDYENGFSVSGFNLNNNSFSGNFTKILNSDWHINIKGVANQSATDSAIAKGVETDGSKNYQLNLNANKWIYDDLKFKSVFYARNTKSDYDKSASKEESVTADNSMHALQFGLEKFKKDKFKNLAFHYHNYDRLYREEGKIDTYYSESIAIKAESEENISEKISFGYGSEYKYDWGNFATTTFTSQTKGHVKNFGVYGNLGYRINENTLFALHARNDDHMQTGGNQTYKLNLTRNFDKSKIGFTHSTGLRNPSLYELYGSSGFGYSGNTGMNSEKSETNEILFNFKFFENINFTSSAYKTRMKDRIKINSSWTKYENKILDTTQEGLESEIMFKNSGQKISLVSHFAKSRTDTGGPNSRRPDLSYGFDYLKKIKYSYIGPINLNLKYRYIGEHLDWTGSKNEFVKSVDLLDMSLSKDFYGSNISLNFSNLLNERYEKPATYSQDGRKFRLIFRRNY